MLCNVIRPILVAVILFDLGEMFRRLVFCFGRHDYMCRLVSVSDSTMCVSMCAYDREHAMNEANRMFWIIVYDSIGLVRETTAQWCNFHKHTQVCARHNTTKKKPHTQRDRQNRQFTRERARALQPATAPHAKRMDERQATSKPSGRNSSHVQTNSMRLAVRWSINVVLWTQVRVRTVRVDACLCVSNISRNVCPNHV